MIRSLGIIPAYAGNTLFLYLFPWYTYRIIPAYAGNTFNAGRHRSVSQDHPRLCGEHYP